MLGVAVGSVSNWIDQGSLKAGRTPGGHRRVETADLMDFLRRQKLPIPPELSSARPKILVVDDEPAVRKWLVAELSLAFPQAEILQADDGFSAGEVVGARRPEVVILDLRMPNMDGFEVCRRIKAEPRNRGVGIIAMTAYSSPEAQTEILKSGASVCLDKPLDLAVLTRHVSQCLDGAATN